MMLRILLILALVCLGWCFVQSVLAKIENMLWQTYSWMLPG